MKSSIFKKAQVLVLLTILFHFFCGNVIAQEQKTTSPILFIYDASGSMWGQMDGKTKKEIASDVLSTTINKLPNNQNIGLIAYGHRKKGDCKDVEFLAELNNNSKSKLTSAIKAINPLGRTPLAYSATKAINSLKTSKTKATIILVTDGIESCDGNICDVVTSAKEEGIDFKLHIVGFGLKEGETKQLKCAASAGEGNYYDASDASGLGDVLTAATSQTIDESPGNYTVYATKNGKPIDALVHAYKSGTKDKVDGVRTYGDTSYLSLPQGKYDLTARALAGSRVAPVTVFNVQSYDNKIEHQTISFDGGKINIITLNNNEGWDCTTKVKNKDGKVVGGSRTYGKPLEVEVNPGVYDVEVLALRMKGLEIKHTIKDVVVEAGKIVDAKHNYATGIANIGVEENGALVDVVIGIMTIDKKTSIAGARSYTTPSSNPREFILNPGTYALRLRGRKNGKDNTKWFEITVKEGESFTKVFEW